MRVLPYAMVLLLVPVALGVQPLHEVLYVLAFLDIAWLCGKVGGLYPDGRLLVVLFFVGSASLQALVALAQYVTGNAFNLYGGAGSATYSAQSYFFNYGTTARTTGTFFDPISLGNVLAMALPLALLLVLRSQLPGRVRLAAAAAGVILVGGLAVSLSRASWIAAAVGVIAVALFSHGDQRRQGGDARSGPHRRGAVGGLGALRTSHRHPVHLDPAPDRVERPDGDRETGLARRTGPTSLDVFEAQPDHGGRFRQPGGETRGDRAR